MGRKQHISLDNGFPRDGFSHTGDDAQGPGVPDNLRDELKLLPKVVVFDVLEGGVRPATLVELCEDGADDDNPDARENERRGAAAARSHYARVGQLTSSPETITRIACEAVEDLSDDGVVYAEIHFQPLVHTASGVSLEKVMGAVGAGISRGQSVAEKSGHHITARGVVMVDVDDPRLEEVIDATIATITRDRDALKSGQPLATGGMIVGCHLVGQIHVARANATVAGAITKLRRCMVPFVIDADNGASIDDIADAIVAGCTRIGGGGALYEDFTATCDGIVAGPVTSWVIDRRLPLDMTVSRDLQRGIYPEPGDHPISLYAQMGVVTTINTGDRQLGETTMTQEMALVAHTFDMGLDQLYAMTKAALDWSFVDYRTRRLIASSIIDPAWKTAMGQTGGNGCGCGKGHGGAGDAGDADDDSALAATAAFLGGWEGLSEEELAGIDPSFLAEMGLGPDEVKALMKPHHPKKN